MHKILVANRAEIAVRVIRAARQLGYRTVAVYSEADSDALHVVEADEAVCIGPAAVGMSYLVIDNILEAARKTGADAVHPGYGFLSENADFARACEQAGLVFIGPGADAIALMGSKRLSKLAMLEAGVPCIPGYQGAEQDDATLLAKAEEIGVPLMVKASAGGGGRGMRLVTNLADLQAQLTTARSEARSAFGSDELILERAVLEPRHIEIQVFADQHGNVLYLGERDCSVQRRHQKVVEEAPSPFVDASLRQQMGEAAVAAARSCNYRGAGTVEFLVDGERNFYFLEMNTRLQVEHPVTEMVTGLDLVAWQFLVAEGEPLPLTQDEVRLQGHAVEVRLYAENPHQDFMPQTGRVARWQLPEREGVRIDHGVRQGQTVSSHYDPMLAKVIAHGDTRAIAVRRAAAALQDTSLLGVNNNKRFLQNILRHPVFAAGAATTAFIDDHFRTDDSMIAAPPSLGCLGRAAVILATRSKQPRDSWRSAAGQGSFLVLAAGDETFPLALCETGPSRYCIRHGDDELTLELHRWTEDACVVVEDGVRASCSYALEGDSLHLDCGEGHVSLQDITHRPAEGAGAAGSGELKASMDGAIVQVLVREGDTVERGQTLVVLEAMKMEHQLQAGVSGTVQAVHAQVGQQVKSRQLLASVVAQEQEG